MDLRALMIIFPFLFLCYLMELFYHKGLKKGRYEGRKEGYKYGREDGILEVKHMLEDDLNDQMG
mgnify:CR=1 FL=1